MFGWIAGAMLASLGVQDVPAPAPAPAARPADSPAMAAARANRARMKAPPRFKDGPHALVPEAAQATGEHGKVSISAILGADGEMTELSVKTSSRSDKIDAAAIEAARQSRFEPARDADGNAIAVPVVMPFDFSNGKTPGKGGGILRYRCGQLVRDFDWWAATWPGDQKDEYYTMILGVVMMDVMRQTQDRGVLTKRIKLFEDKQWPAAIAACRVAPDKLFIDVFEYGPMLRALAKAEF